MFDGKKFIITPSPREDKKYKVIGPGIKKPVHFGQAGVRASPGTPRGNRYCIRSYDITNKTGNPTRNNINSANFWSRKYIWKCQGKKSLK